MNTLELKQKIDNKEDFILLDIRTPYEYNIAKIDCLELVYIPMQELQERINELDKTKEIVVYCHTGGRSRSIVGFLKSLGYNAKNLDGGIKLWSNVIDPKVKQY
jgi:sulfur-carrier protein adenylyltransferase/sulfurtransferase